MDLPLTPSRNAPAPHLRNPWFPQSSHPTTPMHFPGLATSVNEPPSSPVSLDAIQPVAESRTAHSMNATAPSFEPLTPVDPKMNLLFHVNYIRELLARQNKHVLHLKAATVGQAQLPVSFARASLTVFEKSKTAALMTESPELRGGGAMAVVVNMISTWECSVEATINLVDQLGDSIRLLGLGEEPEEPYGVAVSAATCTASDSSANSQWRPTGDWDIVQTGDGDPFVSSPAKTSFESAAQVAALQLHLSYHPDIATLNWPRIYMPPSPYATNLYSRSRRVLFRNLPPSVGLTQLLRGIHCYGGIITASIVRDLANSGSIASLAAVVEFVYPDSAAKFVCSVGVKDIMLSYAADDGTAWEARVSLIATDSFSYTTLDHALLENGATRALGLRFFPMDCLWCFLDLIGLDHVTDVWYNEEQDDLVLEFTCLFQAGRVKRSVEQSRFDFYCPGNGARPQYVSDSTQHTQIGVADTSSGTCIVDHLPKDHLQQSWNRPPYNRHVLVQQHLASVLKEHDSQDETEPDDVVKLRTWERYGRLARHRREKSTELGVEQWCVPRCEARCPWGCVDMKASPLPSVIKEYLDATSQYRLLSTHEETPS